MDQVEAYAGDLSARHKLATAGAIVYARTQAYDVGVRACDRHFEHLATGRLTGPAEPAQ